MKFLLETLTPLWTGGIEGTCDRLHETGIIGSLRWWYEVIARGLGGDACAADNTCPKKLKIDGEEQKFWCDACDLFGMTGLGRAFRLEIDHRTNFQPSQRLEVKVDPSRRGWFLGRGMWLGDLEGKCLPIRTPQWSKDGKWLHALGLALKLASRYGGIGARARHGYAAAEVTAMTIEKNEWSLDKALAALSAQRSRSHRQTLIPDDLPDLRRCFFASFRLPVPRYPRDFVDNLYTTFTGDKEFYFNNHILAIAPAIRYYLRALFRTCLLNYTTPNAAARWRLMGVLAGRYHQSDFGKIVDAEWRCSTCQKTWSQRPSRGHGECKGRVHISKWECLSCKKTWNTDPTRGTPPDAVPMERHGSLFHVSHAYLEDKEMEFRLWGWIPDRLEGNVVRETVLKLIAQAVGWRDYDLPPPAPAFGTLWSRFPAKVRCVRWREFNSSRDCRREYTPGEEQDFLRSLLEG